MAFDMPLYLANMRKFLANRPSYPPEELAKYGGTWIAWSPDVTRIVASAKEPDELEGLVCAAGEDPLYCVVEGIPESDSLTGGGPDPG